MLGGGFFVRDGICGVGCLSGPAELLAKVRSPSASARGGPRERERERGGVLGRGRGREGNVGGVGVGAGGESLFLFGGIGYAVLAGGVRGGGARSGCGKPVAVGSALRARGRGGESGFNGDVDHDGCGVVCSFAWV